MCVKIKDMPKEVRKAQEGAWEQPGMVPKARGAKVQDLKWWRFSVGGGSMGWE